MSKELSIGAYELQLYLDNDRQLHQLKMGVAKNLATKKARGTFDKKKAPAAFMPLVKHAAMKYTREHAARGQKWYVLFPPSDRKQLAEHYVDWFLVEYKLGNFESLLPKKYQKGATRAKTRRSVRKAFEALPEREQELAKEAKLTKTIRRRKKR